MSRVAFRGQVDAKVGSCRLRLLPKRFFRVDALFVAAAYRRWSHFARTRWAKTNRQRAATAHDRSCEQKICGLAARFARS